MARSSRRGVRVRSEGLHVALSGKPRAPASPPCLGINPTMSPELPSRSPSCRTVRPSLGAESPESTRCVENFRRPTTRGGCGRASNDVSGEKTLVVRCCSRFWMRDSSPHLVVESRHRRRRAASPRAVHPAPATSPPVTTESVAVQFSVRLSGARILGPVAARAWRRPVDHQARILCGQRPRTIEQIEARRPERHPNRTFWAALGDSSRSVTKRPLSRRRCSTDARS